MIFERLSTLDGLPEATVYTTLHDSQGFIWFGTEDGLVRYDGHDIYRYAYSPQVKGGLPGNFIFAIAEDAHGDLWLATKGAGLARWNRTSDTFTVYKHDERNPASIASDSIRTLVIDGQGRIWMGMLDSGVDVLDPRSGAVEHLRRSSTTPESLTDDHVYSMMEEPEGGMWIGTQSGIDRWRLDGDRFIRVPFTDGQPLLGGEKISAMVRSSDGTVWVATYESGLHHVSARGHTLTELRHDSADPGSIASDEVRSLLDDHAGHLWIGSAAGLDALNLPSMDLSHYTHDKSDPDSLSDSFIMSLYEDEAGLMWIGTRSAGVNRWNSHSWELGGRNPGWLDGKWVVSFADAPGGHVWVGTMGGGLFNFDPETGDAINLDTMLHEDNVLGDRRIMSLHRDSHGNLWIGTWSKGLERLSPDGKITSIGASPHDPHALSAPGIAAIYEAKNGLLWIGTHGGGANILDPETGIVRQLPRDAAVRGATTSENIISFIEDGAGNIWMGTENGGLDVANAQGFVFHSYKHDLANPDSLSSNIVYALERDAGGHIWAATDGGGLDAVMGSSLRPMDVKFQTFSKPEGLTSDTIYGVLRDGAGQLWLSGNAGLMRFDPVTHAVKTYHREHGLQGEEFSSGAYFRTQAGRLCFGGAGGLNVFDPSRLAATSQPPRIALTGIEVLGAPVHEATPNWLLQRVALDYHASVVSFDFAALDFTSPRRNRLAYRVSQLTDKWIDLNSQRRVTLTSLPAGDHILEVRAANADSVWSTVPYRLTIHKEPAPWVSAPACAAYALLAIALIFWAARAQRDKLRGALAAQQRLESEVALRTKELRDANQQLIIASEAKSDFLARMGHELRTPMNGVVGMTELIARSPLSVTQARQLETIRTSAKTLLQILNDLLDLSKAQAGKTRLESLPLDINLLIEECVAMFTGATESKGIDLIVCPAPPTALTPLGDPLRIRQLLMNLVGNAVKFTQRGEVVVTCDMEPTGPELLQVKLAVADTGVGISAAAREKIFEPFTQADETTTRRFGGTGLGLSICHELTQLMGGNIVVDSEPNQGSTFTITFVCKAQSKALSATPIDTARAVLLVTERHSLRESLRRHTALLGLQSRPATLDSAAACDPNDIVVLDADSYPAEIGRFMAEPFRNRTVVVANPATIEAHRLEAQVAANSLLRNPIQRDAFHTAMTSRERDDVALSDGKHASFDAMSTFLFPAMSAHVLIVEDDEVNAAVAEGYLAMSRCSSVWLKDGLSAVSRCENERFDLILMDLNMPGLDGYETTRRIRALEAGTAHTPIIALTANESSAYRDACLLAGMDDILSKPYSLAELTALLRRWVDATSQRRVAAPNGAPRNLTLVDIEGMARIGSLGGGMNNALLNRLVTLFEAGAEETLLRIDAALKAQDWESARQAAHKLKGAAGNVGAHEFAAQLAELETNCNEGDAAIAHYANTMLRASLPALLVGLKQHSVLAIA
jgi:signal transduction histidine kinase/ligand-binding sensor domain-containing protein/HPt (histidine-containing phosphotransfer) domain-containing protein/FixJ family two-component response regulator